jgi:hypothetical protein
MSSFIFFCLIFFLICVCVCIYIYIPLLSCFFFLWPPSALWCWDASFVVSEVVCGLCLCVLSFSTSEMWSLRVVTCRRQFFCLSLVGAFEIYLLVPWRECAFIFLLYGHVNFSYCVWEAWEYGSGGLGWVLFMSQ